MEFEVHYRRGEFDSARPDPWRRWWWVHVASGTVAGAAFALGLQYFVPFSLIPLALGLCVVLSVASVTIGLRQMKWERQVEWEYEESGVDDEKLS